MIRRPYRDGWLLIPQPAHAWLSGMMAQSWGNDFVDRPTPYQSIALGTMLHDAGWMAVDDKPRLNTNDEPLNFLEPDLELAEPLYRHSVSYVMQIDPYAGLLVSRHMQVIYNSRAIHGRDPQAKVQPLLDQLQQQEAHTIEQLRHHPIYHDFLDEDTLNHNYRILRTCDLLSLFLCGGFPEADINNVPLRYGEPFETLSCQRIDETTLQIQPYLFAEPELNFTVTAYYLPETTFESAAVLQEMLLSAEQVNLTRKLVGC